MSVQLVIFDCDGVLVDTERVAARAASESLTELGWSITEQDAVDLFMGRKEADNLARIGQELGEAVIPVYLEKFTLYWQAAFTEAGVKAIPGIPEVLAGLTCQSCVASSGSHEKMRMTLGSAGLYQFFEGRIFSSSEVPRGKPFPDLFLHAANTLQVLPEHCVVIEDSSPGVQAAVAAGMRVFGYADLMSAELLAAAGARVFTDMRALPALLAHLA